MVTAAISAVVSAADIYVYILVGVNGVLGGVGSPSSAVRLYSAMNVGRRGADLHVLRIVDGVIVDEELCVAI